MKFLVITDLHQKGSRIPWINSVIHEENPDCTLFLGDVTDMGTSEDAIELLSSIDSKIDVLPGNCDPRDMPSKISSVAVDMHGKSTEIDGYYIAGLGGSNPTIFDTPFELEEDVLESMLRPISKKGMILMTHAPAFGTLDRIPSGVHVGSHAIRKILDDYHPVLALSGHIHEDMGTMTVGSTLCINPGPARDGRCAIIDMAGGRPDVRMITASDLPL